MLRCPLSSRPRLIPLAIAAGFLTLSAFAFGTISVVITENSPFNFTATYNGAPLIPSSEGRDRASFSLPTGIHLFTASNLVDGGNLGFSDPEDPALFDRYLTGHNQNGAPVVSIHSDLSVAVFQNFSGQPLTLFPDGSSLIIGFDDVINQNDIVLTFHDNAGNTESVPDKGSTLTLFALASAGLFRGARFRAYRLA